jgi:hypothetical protein
MSAKNILERYVRVWQKYGEDDEMMENKGKAR